MAGSPIAHSLSPVLHRAAWAELGLDWQYDAIECDEAGLPALVAALAAAPEFVGMSLTMPLKSKAYELADRRAPSAVQVGVANTLLMSDGSTTAYNTDIAGLVFALRELGVERPPFAPVVLGGGGTARAAVAALAGIGSTAAALAVRRPEAARPLVELGSELGIVVSVTGWPTSYEQLASADLVIATAPAGATDGLAATGWRSGLPLLEVLYSPWPTRLAASADAAGAPVVGGLSLLVGQAAEAVELMTGSPAPVAAMRSAGEAALAARTKTA